MLKSVLAVILKCKFDIVTIITLLVSIFAYFKYVLNFTYHNLQHPLGYVGYGDGMQQLMYAKNIIDTGWVSSSTRLGLNGNTFFYDFPICLLDNVGSLLLKIYLYVTANNVAFSVNLTNLTFPCITAVITYMVFRCFRINQCISAIAALLYTFLPYWFMRFGGHYWLAELQNAPLTLLLCYWIYTDDEFVKMRLTKKNFVSIIICLLIANSGIGYYQFFSCLFIFATGVIKFASVKKMEFINKSVAVSMLIGVLFAVNLVPAYSYNSNYGDNSKIVKRSPIETELYGTKISYLVLPQNQDLSISKGISERYKNYIEFAPLKTENRSAFLGYVGVFGFFLLILCLFTNPTVLSKELFMLSRLNIIAVLFSTIGGGAALFAIFVTPSLRSTNRISIYIGFMCILSIILCMQKWINNNNSFIKTFVCMILLLVGLFIQIPHAPYMGYDIDSVKWNHDKSFIAEIENTVPVGASIWQIPYMAFPENGPVNEMMDYAPMIGYVHSDKLKWSYGSVKGREWDNEYERISKLPIDEQLDTIEKMGISGIYIDLNGLKDYEYEDLKDRIVTKFNSSIIRHPDNKIVFFTIR